MLWILPIFQCQDIRIFPLEFLKNTRLLLLGENLAMTVFPLLALPVSPSSPSTPSSTSSPTWTATTTTTTTTTTTITTTTITWMWTWTLVGGKDQHARQWQITRWTLFVSDKYPVSATNFFLSKVVARVQRRASERFLAWFGQTLEENPECLLGLLCALNNNNNNVKNKDNEDINNNNSWFQGSGLIAR